MAEGSNILPLILGGAAIGAVGYYLYMRDKDCGISIAGGETSQYECYLKMLFGCKWDGSQCVSGGQSQCSDLTQEQCVSPCHWCSGACQVTPCGGGVPCSYPGQIQCFSTPQTQGNNSYECVEDSDSSTGYSWLLRQTNHPDCPDNMRLKCFTSVDDLNSCQKTLGETVDACYAHGNKFGCPCDIECETSQNPGFCCSDSICQWRPSGQQLNIPNRSDWIVTPGIMGERVDWDVSANPKYPYIYPFASSKLTSCIIHYYDGPFISAYGACSIIFQYKGSDQIFQENLTIFFIGSEGDITIAFHQNPALMCIDILSIVITIPGYNPKIRSFIGNFS